MKDIKTFFKLIRYGLFLEYHLSRQNVIDTKHLTVAKYHSEMAAHYFYKIYGYDPRKNS